ncbi:LytR/AlgR family response regulator transcription factor [Taibaiella koreensis]|uniref:LytR/AlgR family response regulator transcription factor n=1 Tax=Taibaiella koreensis TaxID=1268548 RepID=UPI000E59DBFE|nr:LytTR family DNA-binding domain-containing protein [Taibaiella koreensis]
MIKAFLLDDQDTNISVLKSQLTRYFPQVSLCGTATDSADAIPQIVAQRPDLLFLDIYMPGIDAFELLHRLEEHVPPELVFVTAYSEYALKAFEHQASGYLTKPVDAARLVLTVSKILERIQQRQALVRQEAGKVFASGEKKLALATQKGWVFVAQEAILYCESSGNYTTFFLNEGRQILVSRQIGTFEQLLPQQSFLRIHDRYIVNLKYICSYQRGSGGMLVLENGKELPVSVRRKEQLLQYFK